jgi:SAM-dependent methyltransferase
MRELSKSIVRRRLDSRFSNQYFVGEGIDIGGKPDPLELYSEFFPLMGSVRTWDWEDGDAQEMSSVPDETYTFVHSSHCLEHLVNPKIGLRNWFRILKPGGHLIVTVPDEDLYEQGAWPSTFNFDHKWSFTINKIVSWSPVSLNVFDLLRDLGDSARIKAVQIQDLGYRYSLPRYDQTSSPVSESAIEFIVQKMDTEEIQNGGYRGERNQPTKFVRRYLNQYQIDYKQMKDSNSGTAPFLDERELR